MIPHHAAGLKSVFSLLFSSALLSQPGCQSTADALSADASAVDLTTTEWVGPDGSGKVSLPVNQILTPVGIQVVLPGSRPEVLALSPDGRVLATSGKTHDLILLDPESGKILERAPLRADATEPAPTPTSPHILEPDTKGQASYTGLIFSADGSRIFLSNVNGNIKVFGVDGERKAHGLFSIPLPLANAEGRKEDIPAGLAISPDGKFLYVALNLSNRLGELELEASAGKVLRLLD